MKIQSLLYSIVCKRINPNIKVYEVADQVGIQTSAYFTYLFKKMVGSTPQKYRDYHYSKDA
ncbi:helix-turn-helix transcriptional regulator [Paenibacillus psychroresistens]|nr:AraC family transcriptional regulator [Paenibacillus psychroresistens]